MRRVSCFPITPVMLLALLAGIAHASPPLSVTTLDDIVADDGQCSLREAVSAVEAQTPSGLQLGECAPAGAIVIQLPTGTLTLAAPLALGPGIQLQGYGAAATIIQAGPETAPLLVVMPAVGQDAAGAVSLHALGITAAPATLAIDHQHGHLTLDAVALTGRLITASGQLTLAQSSLLAAPPVVELAQDVTADLSQTSLLVTQPAPQPTLLQRAQSDVYLSRSLISGAAIALDLTAPGATAMAQDSIIEACVGALGLVSQGHNALGIGCPTTPQDLFADPLWLAPATTAANGTLARLPTPQSPLVGNGDCFELISPTDQRGLPRIQGAGCDIGPVELAAPALFSITPTLIPTAGGLLTLSGAGLYGQAPSVTLGAAPCPVIAATATTLTCMAPAGAGLNRSLRVTADGVTSPALLVSYVPPTLTALAPPTGPTAGGQMLTLTGTGLDHPQTTVRIHNAPCVIVSQAPGTLTCTTPPGVGAHNPVTVSVLGQSAHQSLDYGYDAPFITGHTPTTPTTEGALLTLTGQNFGLTSAQVAIDGRPCPLDTQADSLLTCWLPPGVGRGHLIQVEIADQAAPPRFLDYAAPTILHVQPQSALGGQTLSLNGADFGPSGASVTVGAEPCLLLGQTSHQLTCMLPPGAGSNHEIVVTVAEQTALAPTLFSYGAPTIQSLSPSVSDTSGGAVLTLQGAGFGPANAIVTVGGAPCPILAQDDTTLQCVLPAGAGADRPVTVTTAGQSSQPALFSYAPPAIDTLWPQTAPAGATLTLQGTGFGAANATVAIGGTPCPVTAQTHTSLSCIVPPGVGDALPITVTVAAQTSAPVPFSYLGPALLSFSPLTAPTTGGVLLTLLGSGFGPSGAIVTVGGLDCPLQTQLDAQLTCLLPPNTGAGHPLTLTVGDTILTAPTLFNYEPPTVAAISPPAGPSGALLTLTGSGFGPAGATVTLDGATCVVQQQSNTQIQCTAPALPVGAASVQVTVSGQPSNPRLFSVIAPALIALDPTHGPTTGGVTLTLTATGLGQSTPHITIGDALCPITGQTGDTLTCALPAGAGAQLPVRLTAAGLTTAPFEFSFDPPLLASASPATLRSGQPLTLIGQNFGPQAPAVTIGGRPCPVNTHSHTQVVCTIPPGSGPAAPIALVAAGQTTAPLSAAYAAPKITTVSPPAGPTAGQSALTLTGTGFGLSNLTITVGDVPCPLSGLPSDTRVTCTLPAGSGGLAPIVLIAAGQPSPPHPFAYLPPTVQQLTPSTAHAGALLTLTGANFGTLADVQVGVAPCPVQSQTQTQLTCIVPAGAGAALPVVVTVSNQTSAPVFFDYAAPEALSLSPTTGPTAGGTTLTLAGQGLVPDLSLTIGDLPCPILSQTDTALTCALPAGVGAGLPVRLTGPGVSTTIGSFSYRAPTLIQASPTPLRAGQPITLSGQDFGAAGAKVQLDHQPCVVTAQTHTELTCLAPVGNGAGRLLTVSVGGQISNTVPVAYAPPDLQPLSQAPLPTAGEVALSLHGSGFGTTSAQVIVDGVACPVLSQSDTAITCTLPAGAGLDRPVRVIAAGQTSPIRTLNYAAPRIFSVTPSAVAAGVPLTLTGQNFAASGATVVLGGRSCAVTSQTHSQVQCVAPVLTEPNPTLVLTVAGQASPTLTLNAAGPVLQSVSPSVGPAAGGAALAITGIGFDAPDLQITVGGRPCPLLQHTSNTLSCALPAGAGASAPIVAQAFGQPSSPLAFAYRAPTLSAIEPATGFVGDTLHLHGTDFSLPGVTEPAVTIGGVACAIQSHTDTDLTCRIPAGTGPAQPVVVQIAGQTANPLGFAYAKPILTAISPPDGPTQGGVPLTLTGAGFLAPQLTVEVGGRPCEIVSVTSNTLVCTLPAGVGVAQAVVVSNPHAHSAPALFAYRAPTIISVSPPVARPGETLRIIGSNFGTHGAIATIDGVPCPVQGQTHEALTCLVPPGTGASLPVSVQVAGQVVTAPAAFGYAAPEALSLNPTHVPTVGGTLTITGQGFGPVGARVTLGDLDCPVFAQTDTSLSCLVPPGTGRDHSVLVIAATQTVEAGAISYQAPSVVSVSPKTGSPGALLSLLGANFGASAATVDIGGHPCPVKSQTHTQITCQIPVGTGKNQPVQVTVGGQSSLSGPTFSWSAPTIAALAPASSPTPGGVWLDLLGTGFGTRGAEVSVGHAPCEVGAQSNTHLRCRVPAGVGAHLAVTVTVDAQQTTQKGAFSYQPPQISALKPALGIAGEPLHLSGQNFGAKGAQVLVGGAPCPVTQQDHHALTCTLPVQPGLGTQITLKVGDQTAQSSAFAYRAPQISNVDPSSGPTQGGIEIRLAGQGFGATAAVTIGGVSCPVLTQTDIQLTCRLPQGVGPDRPVVVSSANQSSQPAHFGYAPPRVIRALPASVRSVGGRVVTLLGENFGASEASVTAGGLPCDVLEQTHTALHFVMPGHAQGSAALVVTVGGQASEPTALTVWDGVCTSATNGAPCDDGDPCTQSSCHDGACLPSWHAPDGTACHAASACQSAGACEAGECVGAEPIRQDQPCDDADPCTTSDRCAGGACSGIRKDCGDSNPCTVDACDNGTCINAPFSCDDKNPCTRDQCDGFGGCLNVRTVGASCDDGDPCTTGDTCTAYGGCGGHAVSCDDGDPCTTDLCDNQGGCQHEPTRGGCDDGNPCTTLDLCTGGGCQGAPLSCDDGDPCTTDWCGAGACFHAASEAPCDDSDLCTADDRCDNGICQGTPTDCDDGDPCTADACLQSGDCAHTLRVCTDGDPSCLPACVAAWEAVAAAACGDNPNCEPTPPETISSPGAAGCSVGAAAAGHGAAMLVGLLFLMLGALRRRSNPARVPVRKNSRLPRS